MTIGVSVGKTFAADTELHLIVVLTLCDDSIDGLRRDRWQPRRAGSLA